MSPEGKKKLYEALSAPFPEEAVERTKGQTTGRGYDTTGIKYQYIVNRMNEVLGVGGFRTRRKMVVKDGQTSKGRPCYEAICEVELELGEWRDGEFVPFAQAIGDGGHTALAEADARKGAYTQAIKKAAAMVAGVGRNAYEGTIDDDNTPLPERKPRSGANGANGSNGRVTLAQLDRMKDLVSFVGRDWNSFRRYIRDQRGVNVEYTDAKTANAIIADLTARAERHHGSNGAARAAS